MYLFLFAGQVWYGSATGRLMVKTKTFPLLLFILTAAATAYAAEPTTEVSGPRGNPAAISNSGLPAGDHLLSNGTFVAIVGASPRPHLDFYGFPTTNAY
jgi:hypothetical protein